MRPVRQASFQQIVPRKPGLAWPDKSGKDGQILYMGYPEVNQALMSGDIGAMMQAELSRAINKWLRRIFLRKTRSTRAEGGHCVPQCR